MATFIHKPKKPQENKLIPVMKRGFSLKRVVHKTQQWVILALLVYVAIKVS